MDQQLEFDNEYQLIAYIRKELLDDEQKARLAFWDISISDLLNGRIIGDLDGTKYNWFFDKWNAKLGRKEFGF